MYNVTKHINPQTHKCHKMSIGVRFINLLEGMDLAPDIFDHLSPGPLRSVTGYETRTTSFTSKLSLSSHEST